MSHPRLVFAEFHDSQVNVKMLQQIIPKLKELGYDHFLDEMPDIFTRDILLEELSKAEAEYEKIKKSFCDLGLEKTDDECIEKYVKKTLAFFASDSDLKAAVWNCKKLIIKHENGVALKRLLILLDNNGIAYQGIDPAELSMFISDENRVGFTPLIDKFMADKLIDVEGGVFGRIGAGHVAGVQKNIIHRLEEINNSKITFRFIFMYSVLPEPTVHDKYLSDLPLGITMIDVNKLSVDEIISLITKENTLHVEPEAEHLSACTF